MIEQHVQKVSLKADAPLAARMQAMRSHLGETLRLAKFQGGVHVAVDASSIYMLLGFMGELVDRVAKLEGLDDEAEASPEDGNGKTSVIDVGK